MAEKVNTELTDDDIRMINNFEVHRLPSLVHYIRGTGGITMCTLVNAKGLCKGIECCDCPFEENEILIDAIENKVIPYVKTINLLTGKD